MLSRIGRIFAIVVSVLVIVLSVGGMLGAWGFNNVLSAFTIKVFGVVQGGVQIVDTAVGRVDSLIQTARHEVQQAGESVTSLAADLQANHPLLTALNERVETRLGPGIDKIQEALSPVHDTLTAVSSAVSFANSIPFVQERAPRLDQLDQTLTRLTTLGADVQQFRSTIRALAEEQADQLTQAAEAALTGLVTRLDGGLANIQSGVQAVQAELIALQARLEQRQAQLLFIYSLIALVMTLLFAWVIYSQVVVIRHYWPPTPHGNEAAPTPAVEAPPTGESTNPPSA
jgi:hypothetical protein